MSQPGEPAIQDLAHHTLRGGKAPLVTAWPRGHVWASEALLPTNLPLPTPHPAILPLLSTASRISQPAGSLPVPSLPTSQPRHTAHSPGPCQDLASSLSPGQQGSEVGSLVLAAPGPWTEPNRPFSQAGLGWAAAAAGGPAEVAGFCRFPIKLIHGPGCLGGSGARGFSKRLEPGEKLSSPSASGKAV